MKLTLVGGGGFRVPQIVEAVAAADAGIRVDEVCLVDTSPERLRVMAAVLAQLAPGLARPPVVTVTTDLDDGLRGADFVFSAIRIGGTAGRVSDERIALAQGVLGQETIGPGGLAYALRTLPHARALAERVRDVAPEAWVINFTNPAGIITEAMRAVLGDRVIGICDTPIGLVRRAARAVGRDPREIGFDYVGLNHLGWLRGVTVDGRDVLPDLLADDARLDEIEEARLLGFDWVRALGALPNEYLFYYYLNREAVTRIRGGGPTRGEYLDAQQTAFYTAAAADPDRALELWERARHDRESSYMGESRAEEERYGRRTEDVEGGGYQQVALDLMTALVPQLSADAVVEVPCTVDFDGVHPHRVAPLTGEMAGLVVSVKACEQLIIRASAERSAELAWRAFAGHPLVDSIAVGRRLLEDYRSQFGDLADLR